jgi:putative DNA primase/helicase
MARVKESAQEGRSTAQPRQRAASRAQVSQEVPPPEARLPDTALPATSRRMAGEPLFALTDVPNEIKALAQHRFGADIRMGTPRENGGPYKGEVFNTESYLIQEVATRSVVFHAKDKMTFVSERLKWCDTNQRLNGADLQIGYDGDRPQTYPWDRARDQLVRAVASLKKSAKELGMSDEVGQTLDALQAKSWSRVKEVRSAALVQSKERQAGERSTRPSDGPDR